VPYFISDSNPDCSGWAVEKEDGEVMGCHSTKQAAIDQMVAISIAEGIEPGGERNADGPPAIIVDIDGTLILNGRRNERLYNYLDTFDDTEIIIVTARLEDDRAETERELDALDIDYDSLVMKPSEEISSPDFKEEAASRLLEVYNVMIAIDNDPDNRERFRKLGITTVDVDEIPDTPSERQVDLTPPAYFRASARRGLQWVDEGRAGDGLLPRTIREARAMAEGNVTADKWVRLRAFLARHMVDFDAPAANPNNENYPSPGVVAIALWGGGGTRRSAMRAMTYAEGIVARLEEENEGRTKGETLNKLETREFEFGLELREQGDEMSLTGYAALFNSRSENLGGFTEVIAPGAFSRSLKSRNDIKLLWNHDTSAVLGSTRAGTLKLFEDEKGLRVEAILPNTTHGRDAKELIKRKDVTGFSFGFTIPGRGGDEWNAEGTERTLKSVRLHEVSLTPFPAYTATNGTAQVRGLDKLAKRAEVDADALADSLIKLEQGEEITSADRDLLMKVIDSVSPVMPAPSEEVVDNSLELLALKKKKLELLAKVL
jgi:HK97 family phage prohead protease